MVDTEGCEFKVESEPRDQNEDPNEVDSNDPTSSKDLKKILFISLFINSQI